ncbi:MAG: bifunctional folylpolyglutamate synthase/dihydrofolate synthase [Candidatus Omnitrophica bacterium]|nr:bifunctional folylpolyglutamate synthase/dihydrofolate synthase [Candidatus Omnitrophota bacterium]
MKPDNFSAAEQYLHGFINYERAMERLSSGALRLDRVRRLWNAAEVDPGGIPAVHIAGTKGKGSCATAAAEILRASGVRVGLYTSPHFFSLRERIRVLDGEDSARDGVAPEEFLLIVRDLYPLLERFRQSADPQWRPTFFEVLTLIAWKYFLRRGVEVMVLETGMGGRLDATNVVTPAVSVLTAIDFDHMQWLGASLRAIASEKAGIIKRGIPVVSACQRPAAARVIRRVCDRQQSPLFLSGREFEALTPRGMRGGVRFDFRFLDRIFPGMKLPLAGLHQAENAACACAAVAVLREQGRITVPVRLKDGLKSVVMPGRFERVKNRPRVVVDVAHNPASFRALGQTIKRYFPGVRVILIFGAAKDKRVRAMLSGLEYGECICAGFSHPRAFAPEQLCRAVGGQYRTARNIKEAFSLAKKLYNKDSLIVVTGSFFLVSEAKAYFGTGT